MTEKKDYFRLVCSVCKRKLGRRHINCLREHFFEKHPEKWDELHIALDVVAEKDKVLSEATEFN